MINVSNAFKQELFNDRRDYLEYVDITLKDGTVLNLTNKDLWGGGITIEDSVSKDNSFDVGSAIINKCTVVINNIYDDYSQYDFGDAKVVVYVGLNLPDGATERIRKGTYTVDETAYNGSIITLQCFDNMKNFDKPYSESQLIYPATLNQIIRDACDVCKVTLQTYNFPHDNFVVQTRPDDEAITFREVVSWCAQIACCFCRCDTLGRLELKWYNQKILEETALDGGDFNVYDLDTKVDGGDFKTWNTGTAISGGEFGDRRGLHMIYSLYSLDIATDDVVITGVRVLEKNKEENQDAITTYQSGTDGYVVSIENNELIKSGAGQTISGWVGEQLIGLRFRKANITHASDPTMEAGDVGYLTDRKGNIYRIIISSTKFSTGNSQNTVSSAQNPARNSAARFSAETKNYVEFRKDIEKERTDREKAQDELKDRIDNSSGLYTTEVTQSDGSTIFYMHDKPALDESMIVWKMTAEAWGVSTDGGETYNAGMTVDGDTIVRILTATGVNADWIKTGALRIEKNGKIMVNMDFDTGVVDMVVNSFSLSSGKTIDSIARGEANKKNKTFTSTPVPPYNVGDIWMNSSTSDIMTCINARSSGAFASSDWQKRNKYIDQTAANNAANNAVSSMSQTDVLNKLTNNGADNGIYLLNGKLYVSFSAARGGTLTLGGANNISGKMTILNPSGGVIGTIDKDGVNFTEGVFSTAGIISKGTTSEFTSKQEISSTSIKFFADNTKVSEISMVQQFLHATDGTYYPGQGLAIASDKCVAFLTSTSRAQMTNSNLVVSINKSNGSCVDLWGKAVVRNTIEWPYLQGMGGATISKAAGGIKLSGNFSVTGTKNRVSSTEDYGDRLLYCYEMSSPMFGDIGEGETDENGECYIDISDVFSETIAAEIEYQVFLQKEGKGDIWIAEKNPHYFIVKGTENLKFAWEIKAKQKGFEYERLEQFDDKPMDDNVVNYEAEYMMEIERLIEEQEELLDEKT